MKNSSLSSQWREVVLGSVLGDGSLKVQKGYRNARFSFKHSIHQEDYFFWKMGLLKNISSDKCYWHQRKDGWGDQKLRFQSLALEELTEIYNLIYKKGKLKIRRKWLNQLTPLSLAVWWLDDGSIIGNGRRGVICTDSFDYESHRVLARYLLIVWGIKVHIGKTNKRYQGTERQYYRLWFRSAEELKKFLRIILPFISIPSMLPKVLLLYKESSLQQRWISEVVQLTAFSKKDVEKCLYLKRQKWSSFRE